MKKISLLSLLLFLTVAMTAQSILEQQFSVKIKREPLSLALIEVGRLANINIGFLGNMIPHDHLVSLQAKNITVGKALDRILRKTTLGYRVENNGIVIYQVPNRPRITGIIREQHSGEPIHYATVMEQNSQQGVTTNTKGFFQLSLPTGPVQLTVSYLGYQDEQRSFLLERDTFLEFILADASLELPEVIIHQDVVRASATAPITFKPVNFKPEKTGLVASPMGEGDLLRNLDVVAGVDQGNDGFGGLHVRGGNADQNLFLLDGVEIIQPAHGLGVFSVFDPNITKSAQLWKNGFNARYGEQLSSVLDITTRDGDLEKFHGALSSSLIATRLTAEGPIIKDRLSFLVTGRRSHLNPYFQNNQENKKDQRDLLGSSSYDFNDLYAKVHLKINAGNRISAAYFRGVDHLDDFTYAEGEVWGTDARFILGNDYHYQWKNETMSLKWNYIAPNGKFSTNALIFRSAYGYHNVRDNFFHQSPQQQWTDNWAEREIISNRVRSSGLSYTVDWFSVEKHHFQVGAKMTYRSFNPDNYGLEKLTSTYALEPQEDQEFDVEQRMFYYEQQTRQMSLFAEDRFRFGKFSGHVGINGIAFYDEKGSDFMLQPRLLLNYQASAKWGLNLSIDHTAQYVQQLTIAEANLPSDPWIPVSSQTGPQEAWQLSLGSQWHLTNGWRIEVNSYFKWLDELTTLYLDRTESGAIISRYNRLGDWEDELAASSARSFGLETTIEKTWKQTTFRFANTLGWSRQYFGNGLSRPHPRDIRHSISIQANSQLNDYLSFYLTWGYRSGVPLYNKSIDSTFPLIDNNRDDDLLTGSTYSDAYHRLDLGFQLEFNTGRWNHRLNLGVYNVYNRENNFLYVPTANGGGEAWQKINALPLLPSVSYRIAF